MSYVEPISLKQTKQAKKSRMAQKKAADTVASAESEEEKADVLAPAEVSVETPLVAEVAIIESNAPEQSVEEKIAITIAVHRAVHDARNTFLGLASLALSSTKSP